MRVLTAFVCGLALLGPRAAEACMCMTSNPHGGRPLVIANATVSLSGPVKRTAKTDDEGKYRFDALPRGAYNMTAAVQGDASHRATATVNLPNEHACASPFLLLRATGRGSGVR